MSEHAPAGTGKGSEQRRERILDAAAALFGGRELASVTMDEVARRAGVAKGTLYNYFASKEDLYASILEARMSHLLSALERALREEGDARIRLRKLVVHTLMFLLKYPDFFRMLRKEELRNDGGGGAAEKLRSALREMLREVLESGIEEGSVRPLLVPLASDLILGAIEGGTLHLLKEGEEPVRGSEPAERFFDMVWRIVEAPAGEAAHPLRGRTVLVTREEGEDGDLSRAIERLGGRPVRLPLLRTAPPLDPAPLSEAARSVASYAWVLFTSARAVEALHEAGATAIPPSTRIGVVGEATAARARLRFRRVDRVAGEESGASLGEGLAAQGVGGLEVLIPRAEAGREDLARILREAGAEVTEVPAYRTLEVGEAGPALRLVREGGLDAVTFASPSAASAFIRLVGADAVRSSPRPIAVASIGPSTSGVLREAGLDPDAEASARSMESLARAAAAAIVKVQTNNVSVVHNDLYNLYNNQPLARALPPREAGGHAR